LPDDRLKAYYETYWSQAGHQPLGWLDQGSRKLLEENVGRHDACLDVGGGDGGTSGLWLAEHAGSYLDVDISESAVARARTRGLDAEVIEDAAALPFADASFDVVVCFEILEHLVAPREAAKEAMRVLRPGGRLLVSVPNVAHWRHRLDLALHGVFDPYGDGLSIEQPWRDPHLRFFTPATLARMLLELGFVKVRISGYSEKPALFDMPVVRRWVRQRGDARGPTWALRTPRGERRLREGGGWGQRRLIARWPSFFALRVTAVARKAT
jgi:ubiquinone/menaquinone biosynthesis C-methylase UbiE